MVVDYPLNQVGNHVLRVGVTYVDPVTGESKSLRKFYRFANSAANNQQQQQGEAIVEAQIRNVSKLPLFVDSIKFLPLPPFTSEEMHVAVQDLLATNGPQTLVYPQEELQRVFRVSYDPMSDPTLLSAQEVAVGQPFLVPISVINNSTRSLALQLQFRKELMHGIVCSSASHQNIGMVEAKTAKTVWIEFLPVVGGLQALSGPVCVDIRSGQEFIQTSELAHVLVASSLASCKTVE
uniref:Uncharacterized protein n=1 Tax=Phytophthora ramorum TaxID=164328 RepID=H3HCM3_PHYRM